VTCTSRLVARSALAALAILCLAVPPALAQDASARGRLLVTDDWLASHRVDANLVLLHVGDREDYAKEHIPGAVFVDLRGGLSAPRPPEGGGLVLELPDPAVLETTLRGMGINADSRIVVYWGSEWVTPTARTIFTLQWAGLGDHTVLLDGGLDAWKAAGQPVTADVPAPERGNVTVRPQPRLVADADWVQAHRTSPGHHLVDGRAAAFYEGVRADQDKSGHIPGAGSIPWTELIREEGLFLKSPEQLRALFTAAGVQPGDTVVAYCHIGQYATMVLFAARTLGHEVVLYDGAFQDWAARGLPVETP
jgi:thiosulfate/3-mercaptopyruvate sulfurtransferase